ncbi:MAG TPA: glycosyltransferase family 2 protein [Phormidium sp.]
MTVASEHTLACILIPVHNRKNTTLNCLHILREQGVLERYKVIVIDDGSTDGTHESVRALSPLVDLITGDGNLWWTGAIRKGMEYAISQRAEWILWLNDDTTPAPGAIETLIAFCAQHSKVIAAANILDPKTWKASYGGVLTKGLKIKPAWPTDSKILFCEALNGNLVCLPASVVEAIGYPNDKTYPHYHGDTIYTHLAKQKGYQLAIKPDAIAYCRNDHEKVSWLKSKYTIGEIIKERRNIKSPHYWKAHLAYYYTLLGILGVGVYVYEVWIKLILIFLFKGLFPKRYSAS